MVFVGSELAGQRASIVMSLVQSARLNGHDPWANRQIFIEPLHQARKSGKPRWVGHTCTPEEN